MIYYETGTAVRPSGKARWLGQQKAAEPLLRALRYSGAAPEPVTRAILLQCYTALDASRQGHGSRDLFMILVRHLLVSEELCRLGLGPDELANIENVRAAIVRLDAAKHRDGAWVLGTTKIHGGCKRSPTPWKSMSTRCSNAFPPSCLCAALAILVAQLSIASLEEIAKAEARMVEGVIRAKQKQAIAEASDFQHLRKGQPRLGQYLPECRHQVALSFGAAQ